MPSDNVNATLANNNHNNKYEKSVLQKVFGSSERPYDEEANFYQKEEIRRNQKQEELSSASSGKHDNYDSLSGYHLRGKAADVFDAMKEKFLVHGVVDDAMGGEHQNPRPNLAESTPKNIPVDMQRAYYNPRSSGPASNLAEVANMYQTNYVNKNLQKLNSKAGDDVRSTKPLVLDPSNGLQATKSGQTGQGASWFGSRFRSRAVGPEEPESLSAYHYSSCDSQLQRYEKCAQEHNGDYSQCRGTWDTFAACRDTI